MGLDEIPIPVRCIVSVDPNRSVMTVFADKKKFLCNTKKPIPLIIVSTNSVQIQKRLPQPIGGSSFNGSGFLGKIKSYTLGYGAAVPTQLIRARDIASAIVEGRRSKGDLLVIRKGNKVTPAHVPDLSDLALLPAALKIAIRWVLQSDGGAAGDAYEHVIPRSIKNIVDPCSVLPRLRECCTLTSGIHRLHTYSDSNDIKLINVRGPFVVQGVSFNSRLVTSNPLDGRKITTTFQVEAKERENNCHKIVAWNCRDMARQTFMGNFKHIIEVHLPDTLILTETRVSINMARVICQGYGRYIIGRSESGPIGGFIVIIFDRSTRLHLHDQQETGSSWQFHRI